MLFLKHLYLDADGGGADGGASGTDGVASVTTDANENVATENTTQEETFDSLIKGKYKADFDKRMQSAIKRRVGDLKELQAENAKMR